MLKSGEAASCLVYLSKFNDPQTQKSQCVQVFPLTQGLGQMVGVQLRREEENKTAAVRSDERKSST